MATKPAKQPQKDPTAPVTFTLQRAAEPGRTFTKFTTGDWQRGQVNATVYVPNADAAGIASVTVTLRGAK